MKINCLKFQFTKPEHSNKSKICQVARFRLFITLNHWQIQKFSNIVIFSLHILFQTGEKCKTSTFSFAICTVVRFVVYQHFFFFNVPSKHRWPFKSTGCVFLIFCWMLFENISTLRDEMFSEVVLETRHIIFHVR